jgi:hypothetical protein
MISNVVRALRIAEGLLDFQWRIVGIALWHRRIFREWNRVLA